MSLKPFDYMQADLQRRYGEAVGGFLAKRIAKAIRRVGKDECLSDLRIADTAKASEVAVYNKIAAAGCCGSVNEKVTYFPTGQTFLFGFNYGH